MTPICQQAGSTLRLLICCWLCDVIDNQLCKNLTCEGTKTLQLVLRFVLNIDGQDPVQQPIHFLSVGMNFLCCDTKQTRPHWSKFNTSEIEIIKGKALGVTLAAPPPPRLDKTQKMNEETRTCFKLHLKQQRMKLGCLVRTEQWG